MSEFGNDTVSASKFRRKRRDVRFPIEMRVNQNTQIFNAGALGYFFTANFKKGFKVEGLTMVPED